MAKRRVSVFSIDIDEMNKAEAVDQIDRWLCDETRNCRYIVTPNVNHIVKLSQDIDFRKAYEAASLVLADGNPIVMASRLLGAPLPEVVPGSDLVPAIFDFVSTKKGRNLKVFLLGAGPGVAERAKGAVEKQWANVAVTGTYSPPPEFERDLKECEKIIARVAESKADLLIIGLGAPKQELWVHQYANRLPVKVALCVGATIDFMAGEKPRAPPWVRRTKLEFLYRIATEPRRLAGRYLYDALVFPRLFLSEYGKKIFRSDKT
jgi:N-acetylglucosaminyldiphosphoundecaprenol N-acetyl-beta-D-mannosaminyltransferase